MKVSDEASDARSTYDVGHGKPPERTRFKPGQSGNPRGRPRSRHKHAPYEAVLGQLVTIRDAGTEKKVTAAEAFLLQLTRRGLEGDNAAARATIRAIEEVRTHGIAKPQETRSICRQIVSPGSVNRALELLRLAKLADEFSKESARMLLVPWIVEAALARMNDAPTTLEQRGKISNVTLAPRKSGGNR
jgi:hypothetical protein